MTADPLLAVHDLSVAFNQRGAESLAVDRISFDINPGETVALVGESGSGKSVSALSILKLLPNSATHPSGRILFGGQDLLAASEKDLRKVRGNDITMIFQEPMTSLNPLHTIERQIGEVLAIHQGMRERQARQRTVELLTQVGIRDPEAPARGLSAPAFRRPAAARHDRHGARQPAEAAHCRRADHRSRRDGPGADPRSRRPPPGRVRHGGAVHHPRPRHRQEVRRPGLRHDEGRDRGARADGGDLQPSAARLYEASARGRAEGAVRRRPTATRRSSSRANRCASGSRSGRASSAASSTT